MTRLRFSRRQKIEALIGHYDNQSDGEVIAEAKAAYRKLSASPIVVPIELLPSVRRGSPGGWAGAAVCSSCRMLA